MRTALFLLIGGLVFSCNNDNDDTADSTVTRNRVVENYAEMAYANYKKAFDDAVVIETAINAFVAAGEAVKAKNSFKELSAIQRN